MQGNFMQPFNPNEDNVHQRWSDWVDKFKLFLSVKKIVDEQEQIDNLLFYGGDYVFKAYLPVKDASADKTLKSVIDKISKCYTPSVSKHVSIFRFRNCAQLDEEPFAEYVDRLRDMAKPCGYANVDEEIKIQIIQCCRSEQLRSRAMQDENLDLAKIISLGKTIESVDIQMKEMSKSQQLYAKDDSVNLVSKRKINSDKKDAYKKCYSCGGKFPHERECPAKTKTCNKCKKNGHFAKVCRSKERAGRSDDHLNMINEFLLKYESDLDTSNDVWSLGDSSRTPKVNLEICKSRITFSIDTGATINLIDEETFDSLEIKPKLRKSRTAAYTYGSKTPMTIIGEFETRVKHNAEYRKVLIHVVQGSSGNILGYNSSIELKVIQLLNKVDVHDESDDAYVSDLKSKYPSLFSNRIGKLKNHLVKLHIDKSIRPVCQKRRPTPVHLRHGIEQAIKQMLDDDIIEMVDGPTPWVSPIVPVIKENGEIRVCTDAKILNTAILREVHHSPTVEELAMDLNGAKVISKIDLRSGYNQLELHPDCRDITVFSTHMGLFRYKRLNFGISSASEEFQKTIEGIIHDIPGTRNISDDIIVFGPDEEKHNSALNRLLQRLEEKGLTLNAKKCNFKKKSLDFFGLNFSADGIKLSQSKVDALLNASDPRDVKELKSLCGLINYCSKFIKDAATLLAPFHDLLKRNAKFNWTPQHSEGLKLIKSALTSDAMGYFDETWDTELTTDASPTGLGAVMAQKDPNDCKARKIILYTSRSLTPVERKYSQVEREALAVVWACERLKLYLIGKPFDLYVDNKAIQLIYSNPKAKVCARIERWSLRLIPFKFRIHHIQGNGNIADYISRHPTEETIKGQEYVEDFINMLVDSNLSQHIKLETIIQETKNDFVLNKVKQMLETNEVNDDCQKPFFNMRNELSISSDGLILCGDRIVIPQACQELVIKVAHLGHQGKEKTKKLLANYVWFTNMNSKVDAGILKCQSCNANTVKHQFEPLVMSAMPNGVWEDLAVDFHGPLPSGDYLMVTIDEFSRFPIVKIIKSTSADVIIKQWREIFRLFGFPKQIKTDNGPPFQSYKVNEFLKLHNIKHRKITPLWPRANAICERFMRSLNRVMKNASVYGTNWRDELDVFLSSYRATPHDSTGVAPAKLMFKTSSTTCNLPLFRTNNKMDNEIEAKARHNDMKAKQTMKHNMDKKLRVKPHDLTKGDNVYIRLQARNKATPIFDPNPYVVIEVKGSMITAKRNSEIKTRNCSHFRKVESSGSTKFDSRLEPIPILQSNSSLIESSIQPAIAPAATIGGNFMNFSANSSESSMSTPCATEQEIQAELEFTNSGGDDSDCQSESGFHQLRRGERMKKAPRRYSDADEDLRLKDLKLNQVANEKQSL